MVGSDKEASHSYIKFSTSGLLIFPKKDEKKHMETKSSCTKTTLLIKTPTEEFLTVASRESEFDNLEESGQNWSFG